MHRVQKNLLLLEALGIKPELLPAGLRVESGDGERVDEFIKEKSLSGKDIVTIHPGVSKFGTFKQWMPERFAEVAKRLAALKSKTVIITWGPGERKLAQQVVSLAGGAPLLGPEPHGLRELAYLLQRSVLFVGCDTGPLHIAAAVGTPVVALFGPKDPAIYGPAGENHVVVRKELECSPCQRRTCPDPRCMRLLTVDDVHDACMKALA
jgi:ADP-heptose:LPS heptosyltransferase